MTDYLLSVPLKKGSEVDLVKPLKNLISSLYSASASANSADAGTRTSDLTSTITEFSRLRTTALSKHHERSHTALEALQKYYDQLVALELKIPPHEVNIPFKWKDAFDKGGLFGGKVSLTVPSLGYEKSCVLFNIGAMMTQLGSTSRISDTDEELKSAAKLFQSAAGIFDHLRQTATGTLGGQEPTPDLTPETLSILSNLMLAQAQEIYIHKAIQDKMKDGLLAKLCMQAEDIYADLLRNIQKDSQKVYWDREWTNIIAGKQAGYVGIANYFQGMVCGTNKAVGEQISRLNLCLEYIKQAQIRSTISNLFADFVNKANRALTDAKKDNDFIYHERIPDSANLIPVEKVHTARIAKLTPVPAKFNQTGKELFEDLVPVPVHQAQVSCELRKSEMINHRIGQLRESTQLLNSILASLNLPAALEDASSSSASMDAIPASLREKAAAIVAAGGINSLHHSINELPSLVQRNKEILDESMKMINEEEETDKKLREQMKEKWTRIPSEKLNGTFKQNGAKYQAIIGNALSADEIVKGKLAQHLEGIQILSGGEQKVAEVLPKSSTAAAAASQNPGNPQAKENLKRLMREVDSLKSTREEIESSIKSLTFDMKTAFLSALAADGAINEPAVSGTLLGSAFSEIDAKIKASLENQERIVAAIQENSDEYFGRGHGLANKEAESGRDQMMRKLAEAFDAYMDLQNNVKEGTQFYNDLTQLLLAYQNKISDYCFARKTEKEELLQDVIRQSSSGGGGSVAVPPARPPPPQTTPAPPAASAPSSGAPPQQQQPPYYAGMPPYQMPMPYATQATPYPTMPLPGYTAYHQMPPQPQYNTWGPPGYAQGAAPGAYAPPPTQNLPYPVQPMGYPPQNYYPGQQQQQPPPPNQ